MTDLPTIADSPERTIHVKYTGAYSLATYCDIHGPGTEGETVAEVRFLSPDDPLPSVLHLCEERYETLRSRNEHVAELVDVATLRERGFVGDLSL